MTISVLGAGSWGSALAIAFSQVAPVTLWGRNKAQLRQIQTSRQNLAYLPEEVVMPLTITISEDLATAVNAGLIVVATPINSLRQMLEQIKCIAGDKLPDILWVCKGLEAGSGLLPHQIIQQVCGTIDNVGALLGPSFAKEVALGLPTAITLTSENLQFALKWIKQFKSISNLRIYANTDVVGSEVGAAVKNIMAIAVGLSDGLRLGLNARAALITRSLSELGRLVVKLGGKVETIYGLTGIGDLILTCTGDLSRNRTVGLELAQGRPIATILSSLGHVAEGVYAVKEVYKLCEQLQLDMPIVEVVYKIIYANLDLAAAVDILLNREPKLEF